MRQEDHEFDTSLGHTFSEQVLPGSEGGEGEREGAGGRGGEMAQTNYAHMNK
jgi:hypothetical protein